MIERARKTAPGALALIALGLGCAEPEPPVRCAHDAARAAPVAAGVYQYGVVVGEAAEQLCVEVDVPRAAAASRWSTVPRFTPYVRDVAFVEGGASRAIAPRDGGWDVPACRADRGCRVQYRVLLGPASRALGDRDFGLAHRGAFVSPPSSWMLRPAALRAPYRLRVTTPPGLAFATGLARAPEDPSAYTGNVGDLHDTPYAIFGPVALRRLDLGGRTLDVARTAGDLVLQAGALDRWIDASARAMASYYGRFPIEHAALLVIVGGGSGLRDGHTMGSGGGAVTFEIGARTTLADLRSDWLLVHEMVHLSFPDVGRPWAEEGIATYLEPIIRARAGLASPDEVWSSMIEGLPNGLPEDGDEGLDHTDTWGRRYWGGALYWFVADLEIRKITSNRRSLDDAIRAINAAGGNVSVSWDLDRVLAEGDRAIGTPVLRPLRERLGAAPVAVDLAAIWKSLGVSLDRRRVIYDDGAPLAAVRKSILAPGG